MSKRRKGPRYVVAPATGRYNQRKRARWNVVDAWNANEVMLGP